MKTFLFGICAVLLGTILATSDAEAKRLGGGRSVGTQRSVTAPPASTPAKPAQQQAAPGAPQPAPAASGFSRWLPMLGGLAIGGLLGSMFGGGGGFGGILLLALLAIGAVMVFKMLARRRDEASSHQPVQFAGMQGREGTKMSVQMPLAASSSEASFPGKTEQPSSIPAGFDTATFLRGAKMNFIKLQAANDTGNLEEIRELATQEMFDVLSRDVRPPAGQHTDVVSLDADLLEVATEDNRYWASVRFSGTVREAPGAAPEDFQEVWNLVKPADGSSGWLLAGIQQMQ